ncbi:MAG: nitronate monooxygenase [Bacteroidetes bacterium]|nr:nitronate monooxygenase [Bacteroidota bacterium]
MQIRNALTEILHLEFPMIMAPMFLVSNYEMMESAMKSGIMGTFPSLNFRKEGELEDLIIRLHKVKEEKKLSGNFGMNLIVQKSNPLYAKHLEIGVKNKVPFYITSLGNPKEVIEKAHAYGAKVFCDVTNIAHAQKCFDSGCDGFIAVGQAAGGHAGPNSLQVLIPSLHHHFPTIPVVAAGGIANGEAILSVLALGAAGVSVGTRFIASTEAKVNAAYKQAIVDSKMDDIVMTTKISGTPCTIINTPYAKKIGYTQNWLEKLLSTNKTTKKYFKMLVQIRGMKNLERSVKPANYDTLWCAGQSVELIDDILSCGQIVDRMKNETSSAFEALKQKYN